MTGKCLIVLLIRFLTHMYRASKLTHTVDFALIRLEIVLLRHVNNPLRDVFGIGT